MSDTDFKIKAGSNLSKNSNNFIPSNIIELIVCISIVSILSFIAIGQYKSYVVKYQITEGLEILKSAKNETLEYLSYEGNYPSQNEFEKIYPMAKDTFNKSKYLQSLNISNNKIIALFKQNNIHNDIANKSLTFYYKNNIWFCESNIPANLLPSICKSIPNAILIKT